MSWDEIQGHEAAKRYFANAWRTGRLGHAYLLHGPAGVGKRRFAWELAKALLCASPPGPLQACDRCPACVQVQSQTHPDLHLLRTPEGKHALPVEEMRQFCEALARTPVRGGRVVGIVEDADDFNPESANAFLKTLEEPPPPAVLLLIATAIDAILPTIRSRCQPVAFLPLRPEELDAVLAAQGITDAAQRQRLVRLAHGSAARALAWADAAAMTCRRELLQELATVRPSFRRLFKNWTDQVEAAGKDTAAQRERAGLVLDGVIDILRQALHRSLGHNPVAESDPSETGAIDQMAQRLGPERLMELLERTVEAVGHIERRVPVVQVFEALLDAICQPTAVGR